MKIVITDYGFSNLDRECEVLAGHELVPAQCKTAEDVAQLAADADALLVQWAPVPAAVINALKHCRIIVRYGIGVDNVNVAAATARGIPVCNVPDYCVDEVADHTVTLALALARQIPQIDARLRAGTWKITPDRPMPAFRQMTFATAGYGRIARAVLERARGFGFRLAAYDPYVPDMPVTRLDLDALFQEADILSLNLPLTPETKHLVNAARLAQMKPTAIVVNTARGGLIDTAALAEAKIGGAGIDVFESEPLQAEHPLRRASNVLLTSHVAWYSDASVPQLQRMAAEEVLRGLRGEPLKNQLNRPERH